MAEMMATVMTTDCVGLPSSSDARLTEVMATVMTTDCVGLPSSSDARLIQVGLTALWLLMMATDDGH